MNNLHLPLLLTSLLLVPLGGLHAADSNLPNPLRIGTGLLEGVSKLEHDVMAFKGIPYTAPPVGNLRWREPQPPAKWDGVRKADKFGASCMQPPFSENPPYTDEFFPSKGPMSEDCLYLNVWTPAKSAGDKLAVLFFIHGGSGVYWTGNAPIYDGEQLAKKGIIVITLNYRLGVFNRMKYPDPALIAESPHHACSNYGYFDMIAALQWVHQNIAAFGGNPNKVTIAGQSSGSAAVHSLTTSPLAKGLFRGAICVSFPYDYLMMRWPMAGTVLKNRSPALLKASPIIGIFNPEAKVLCTPPGVNS